jgi:hypothetical protein
VVAEAQSGALVVTLTAALRSGYGTIPEPLLAPGSGGCTGCGDPAIPLISSTSSDPPPFSVTGTDVDETPQVFVDGQPAGGAITCVGTAFGNCSVDLTVRPANGLHLVQAKNDTGPLSNDLPFCVGSAANCQ